MKNYVNQGVFKLRRVGNKRSITMPQEADADMYARFYDSKTGTVIFVPVRMVPLADLPDLAREVNKDQKD